MGKIRDLKGDDRYPCAIQGSIDEALRQVMKKAGVVREALNKEFNHDYLDSWSQEMQDFLVDIEKMQAEHTVSLNSARSKRAALTKIFNNIIFETQAMKDGDIKTSDWFMSIHNHYSTAKFLSKEIEKLDADLGVTDDD